MLVIVDRMGLVNFICGPGAQTFAIIELLAFLGFTIGWILLA